MKNIIVPVDFSTPSENALKAAVRIAKQHQARLIIVHMLEFQEVNLSKEEKSEEGRYLIELTQKRFDKFLDKNYLKGVSIQTAVRNYKVFSELNQVAKEHHGDLIVMGSHGSSGVQEVFIGSNTEKIVRTSNIPVLVIKDDKEFAPLKGVFACDFKLESKQVFIKAMTLFKRLQIEVSLLYVNLPASSFQSTNQIDNQIAEFSNTLTDAYKFAPEEVSIFSDFSVESGVFHFAEKKQADIIGIPTHGRKGLSHFFSGSIGEDMVNHSSLPVITFKI
jgi:nucleotide-binding universal stress UspA family protein